MSTLTITINEDDLASGSPVRAAVRRAAGSLLVPGSDSSGIYLCTDGQKRLWVASWPEDLKAFLGSFYAGAELDLPSPAFTLIFQRTTAASDQDIAMYGTPADA